MICPKPVHRHCVEQLKGLLLGEAQFAVRVVEAPAWLSADLEEAQIVEHELYLVQWATVEV